MKYIIRCKKDRNIIEGTNFSDFQTFTIINLLQDFTVEEQE